MYVAIQPILRNDIVQVYAGTTAEDRTGGVRHVDQGIPHPSASNAEGVQHCPAVHDPGTLH